MQVFKCGGERFEVARAQEIAQTNFDTRSIPQGGMSRAAWFEFIDDIIFI